MINHEPRTYHLIVYGCQMNAHEAEYMAGLLEADGYLAVTEAAQADVIVVHTCCIRDSAVRKIYGRIGQLKQVKDSRPDTLLAVGGCMTQAPEGAKRLLKHAPHVDIVFGTHNAHRLSEMVASAYGTGEKVVEITEEESLPKAQRPLRRASDVSAYVEIMAGCDNFCGYCIVPYVRGRQRSRPWDDVLAEIEALQEQGYAEIILLGQNVNSYGEDLREPVTFARLLAIIDERAMIPRLRFTTSHPRDFTGQLIDVMARGMSICEQVHLPVQAGSDRILTAMGRGYTRAHYLDMVERLRLAMPDMGLSTDIMVGYPGETEEDFRQTLDLVRQARFTSAYTFMFSPREGTRAARMPEQIDMAVKRRRLSELIELQNAISRECNEEWVGRELQVLIEGPSRKDPQRMVGRSRQNHTVVLPGPTLRPRDLVMVKIKEAFTWHLVGEEPTPHR